ncbi:MAG: NGG1p interacting factor NIF3 [Candidatus Spechtbacteria bacterium RIFCSPHIGHO2_02_FULL_43_15b]|uniref:NGG1p interacting factor NIF3 n=1 Tax=Candidatus Spechtbacteria bacterium RIFCSPHIGHO2_01_FULL_43_30 TaxID=1802158 RepID=A0A1G2H502_9BACT|nr:MAG: NGG1p interacting factor NIF3 [Candidatus Spechtbacteria bacterium RIFCSPHIGHO2_01_FULL_43_30]OGZ58883.1 MAG: NGG1p interacting factor NIF3 [Candidatus Spechtbacteria bacterium RIFCSPHIGHO2_02_FULL_43_15b]
MRLSEIYNLSIQLGIDSDPRGRERVEKFLQKRGEEYKILPDNEKQYFDHESLFNPYSDSRILFGDREAEVRRVMAGIDVEGDELIVAKQLGNIDLAIAHHPRGRALAKLDEVMDMQADVLGQYGVPINIAEALLKVRVSEVTRGLSAGNHYRPVELARLLGVPYMCAHTVTDNLVFQFLKRKMENEKPETVGEILDILMTIDEYKEATSRGSGPILFSGSKENHAGVIAVTEITGGTEGAHNIYEKMANAGIGTVIAMHQSEKHHKFAERAHINVVVAGHMSSDSIGLNIFLDQLEERGVSVVPCSGLIRVKRNFSRRDPHDLIT